MGANRPIGVFDSGVGGLTVAKAIKDLLPNENILYFGDSKHLPYGDKSKTTIVEYCENITRFLIEEDCKLIVVACNTASANALREIKRIAAQKKINVIDVVNPVAEHIAYSFHQKTGVIATKATVKTGVYRKKIKRLNNQITVRELATPLLVPVIEESLTNTKVSKAVIENYLNSTKFQELDSLILGCTHYPLIEKEVDQYYGGKVKIVNSPQIVAHKVKNYLQLKNLLNPDGGNYTFYVSDVTKNFSRLAKKFFGKDISLKLKTLH
ncbi:MAG: glutamate racemase [Weeksellaceae bacterium]|nr:glutamate racemase [Weeksellaceae bacterium]